MSSVADDGPNDCHILWVVRDRTTPVNTVVQQFPSHFQHTFAASLADISTPRQAQTLDVVVFVLPDTEILASLHSLHPLPVPGIVCLDSQNPDLGLAAVQAGAQDYLLTDEITPERLERVIRCVLARTPPLCSATPATTVLHQLPLVVFRCNGEGRITFLNPAWEVLTGLSVTDALGTAMVSYLYPGDRTAFQTICQQQATTAHSQPQTCLVRVFDPTGQCRWCEICLTRWSDPYPAATDCSLSLLGHLYDITEHYLHQQDLQRSEQLWRSYFDSSLVGISIISAENTYVQVNQAFCHLLGYPLPELIHHHWFDLTHPEDLAAELELYQQLCHGEITTYTIDKRFICQDQRTIYVRQSVSGILNTVGELEQMVCTVLDVTDKYTHEAELQASQAFLAHILEGLPDPIFVQDEEHRFLIVNSAFSQLYQKPAEQLVGKTVYDLLPTATADLCAARDAMLFQTQEPQTIEEIFTPPNGQTRILLTKLTVFEATHGYKHIVGIMQDVTEQRRQEQELLTSKHRLEAAQHIAQLGNWEYNLTTQQVLWSQELFYMLGHRPQASFTYVEHLAPIHPDDLDRFRSAVAEAIATQSQCILEYRLQHADGYYCDILGRIQALDTGTSGIITVVGTVLDITERRQASQELQSTKNRLQFLMRTSPAITFSLQADPPHTVTFMSNNVALFLGYTAAEFLGTSELWWSGIHPDDRSRLKTDLALLKMQNHVRREYRFQHKDSHYCWMQDELRLVQEGDNPPEIVGYWTDISARKEAEIALAQSQERLQFALAGSGLGLWDWNLALNEVYLSAEWKTMLGYSPEAISSHWQIWERLIHPEDLPLVWQQLHLHLTGERSYFEIEYRLLTQSKTWKWILARGKVLERDQQGNAWRMTGTHQDISDRKDVAQMKDEFISVVSHELRTPLTSIHGSLKLLHTGRLGILSDRGQEMLAIAVRNTQRLTQLINDILDLERLESGKLQNNKQWCNAQELAQQAVETLQAMAQELGIGLELVCPADFLLGDQSRIWADPLQVIQVLTNLLSNALKFSLPHSTVMLFLSPTATDVLFEIQDEGRGIPSDKLETIFERFQQVDASDTRQKGGTGLGLTICRQIVEQHEGRIWVESAVGEGSSFYFTIPHAPKD